ncbi:MAG: hypothetical protein Q8O64_09405 [Sideroxyarcus sp.]|nr:hypothetical protein [Sideroxyarcus sp.]
MHTLSKNDFWFWLAFFVLVCVSVLRAQDANALLQQVPKSGGGLYWMQHGGPSLVHFPTRENACYVLSGGKTITSWDDLGVYIAPYHKWRCNYQGGSQTVVPQTSTGQCPSDPDGQGPYIYNFATDLCERTISNCAVGATGPGGLFDLGTLDTATLPVFACRGGCQSQVSDGPLAVGAQVLINGVYHYFAGPSHYTLTGQECTGGDTLPAGVAASDIVASCAPGQVMVAGSNGYAKCYTDTGVPVDSHSASSVAAAQTLADQRVADAVAAAGAAAAAAGLSASGIEAAKAAAAASAGGGSGSGSGSGASIADQIDQSFCAKNPSAANCKKPDDVNFSPPGAAPDVSQNWYTKKYATGIVGVFSAGFNAVSQTPLLLFVERFAVTSSAQEHSGCWTISFGTVLGIDTGVHDVCLPPLVKQFMYIAFILTALFVSRRIVFGG